MPQVGKPATMSWSILLMSTIRNQACRGHHDGPPSTRLCFETNFGGLGTLPLCERIYSYARASDTLDEAACNASLQVSHMRVALAKAYRTGALTEDAPIPIIWSRRACHHLRKGRHGRSCHR